MKSILTFCLCFCSIILFAQKVDSTFVYKVNTAFQPGEVLKYEVKYGIIKGGEATIRVDMEPVGDGYLFHSKAVLQTTGIVSKFATIYDIYESYFNILTGYPVKSIRNVTENRYKRYNEVLFGQDSLVVYSMKSGRHEVPPNCLDMISAFYYARRFVFDQKFSKNQDMQLYTWFNEDLYKIKLRYKKTEIIKTHYGKIECLKFVPVLDGETIFKKEDDMVAWFSNDGNYVPIRVKIDMPIASLHCELIGFKNLKNSVDWKFQDTPID